MSSPTPHDAAIPPALQAGTAVTVVCDGRDVGAGQAQVAAMGIHVEGSYNWPPDSIAQVGFTFDFAILSEAGHTCRAAADWPGLLAAPFGPAAGRYHVVQQLARPSILVTTGAGRVTIAFTGPRGHPEITDGIEVTAPGGGAGSTTTLLFRYDGQDG